jgi:hypothetical protein
MSDDGAAKPTAAPRAGFTTDEVRAFTDRAPRCKVRIQVLCAPPGANNLVETQLVNLSRSGMFLAAQGPLLSIGEPVEFQFSLDDEVVMLKGAAEVVRVELEGERGMGLRFLALDQASRELVDRIVDMNSRDPVPVPFEAEISTRQALPGLRAVEYGHGSVRIVLSAATAAYFTYNPLMHIGIGGCFIPTEADVPLGTGYQLDIVDAGGHLILRCKGKVAAKQETPGAADKPLADKSSDPSSPATGKRIGLRLIDVDRAAMQKLRAEIARLGATPGA